MTQQEITTILGKGSSFDGKLTFEGAVRIDGNFSGEIQTEGTLIVGETAEVKAEIQAATVIVQGVVRGDVTATAALELHAPARIYGNINAPSLTIQKGAVFQGTCQMDGAEAGAQAPLTNGKDKSAVAQA
jgi:cytoskeletal protein CcmA (bactofilin family)